MLKYFLFVAPENPECSGKISFSGKTGNRTKEKIVKNLGISQSN